MGYKKVCLACRVTFNRSFDSDSELTYPCPECGQSMVLLPHRFRPPKKSDDKKWEVVQLLISKGFYYQHIYETISKTKSGFLKFENLVSYPDNIRDATEFVDRYKNQAQINETN